MFTSNWRLFKELPLAIPQLNNFFENTACSEQKDWKTECGTNIKK